MGSIKLSLIMAMACILFNSQDGFAQPGWNYPYLGSLGPHPFYPFTVAGRLVLEKKVNEDEKILGIDLKDFTTGLYRIDITDTKGKRFGKTVMVE